MRQIKINGQSFTVMNDEVAQEIINALKAEADRAIVLIISTTALTSLVFFILGLAVGYTDW